MFYYARGYLVARREFYGYFGNVTSAKYPFELAALAAAAIPGMRVAQIRQPQYDDEVAQATTIADTEGNCWLVLYPKTQISKDALNQHITQLHYLESCSQLGLVCFQVPTLSATIKTKHSRYALVMSDPGGLPLPDDVALTSELLASSMAKALASLHNLSADALVDLGARSHGEREIKFGITRLIQSVSRDLPPRLRRRWLGALEQPTLWNFAACPIHSQLAPHCVRVEGNTVSAFTNWLGFQVGDPAEDFAWLLPLANGDFVQRLQEVYAASRASLDLHLMTRAQLYSEIELAKWLRYGKRVRDPEVIEQAKEMLNELDQSLAGALLVEPPRPVEEISFSADEEPMMKLKPQAARSEADIADAETEALVADDTVGDDDLSLTEDLSGLVDDILLQLESPEEDQSVL